MRILRNVILLFVFTACFFEMQAQVQYGLSFDRERYLQYEKIQVTFTVVNNSGTRLNFGTNERSGKMKLLVVDPENRLVSSYDNNFNPMNGLALAAGETKSLVFNVNEHFSMTRQGRYKISASLTHPSLSGLAFETPEKLISINTGTRLKQKNFGVVDMKDSSVIHPRSYDIISFKEQEGDVVCLKVYDKNWVYALMRLGPYVDGVKLNHDVDTFSNIHVLVQVKPRIFLHEVFSDTGTIKQFIVYRATFENVPIMTRDSKLGTIRIYGGEKLIEGEDYIRDGNTIVLRNMEPEAN